MNCPKCGKNIMTKEENERWGYCTECYNGEWSKKLEERALNDIDRRIEQARNTLNNYYRLNKEYGGYDDAVDSYEEYIEKLKSMKEGNI